MSNDDDVRRAESEALRAAAGPNTLDLGRERVLCPIHGEPFRNQWPLGFTTFIVHAFPIAMGLKKMQDDIAAEQAAVPERTNPQCIEAAFDKIQMCCRISKEDLVAGYEAAKIGLLGRCDFCARKRNGTPIKTRDRNYKHVCFDCMSRAESRYS